MLVKYCTIKECPFDCIIFHETIIRLSISYGTGCWAMYTCEEATVHVVDACIRIRRRMCTVIRNNTLQFFSSSK